MLVEPRKDGKDISDDMPWYLPELINMDEEFYSVPDPIIVNQVDITTEDFKETINRRIFKENNLDSIGFTATCDCGYMSDNKYIGTKCPKCNEIVQSAFMTDFKNSTWISTPKDVQRFFHPWIFLVLSDWLKRSRNIRNSYWDDLLNPNPTSTRGLDKHILEHFPPEQRGFNFVYENFDRIIEYFMTEHPKVRKSPKNGFIKKFLDKYRDIVFCTKLPMLAKELHPITKQGASKKYKDDASDNLAVAIMELASITIYKDITVAKKNKIEEITYRSYKSYIEYVYKIIKDKLGTKHGLYISHLYGARLHMSYRGVIRPLTCLHYSDEIHIGWKMGLSTFKFMILNLLVNRKEYNYSPVDALTKIEKAYTCYDWEIDKIFQTLVKEAKGVFYGPDDTDWRYQSLRGIPQFLGRNPGINPGSIQALFLVKIGPWLKAKPKDTTLVDISDNTIGISTGMVPDQNADFDGDNENGLPIVELHSLPTFIKAFHPMGRMVNNARKPEIYTGSCWIDDISIIIYNRFLEDEEGLED